MSRAGAEPFRYRSRGRNRTTAIAVAAYYGVLVLAIVAVEASVILMAVLALFALPATIDLWRDPRAGLDLDDEGLRWFSGTRHAEVAWGEVGHVRLDTRLDFSVRASVVLADGGRKIRLPYESTPPHKALEAALLARGIAVQRHHFSLIG
ncbi:hypothetical protein [Sulfitobacter sabulilitoris]|nr:hypothetical protein [Sulfitobacter sabulilitoris]